MNQRRTLILIAAIAIGSLASFLVWNYVNGVQAQAYSNAERVPVYLVKTAIPRGTAGLTAQASIVKEDIPKKFKPANAITSLEDISGKIALDNLVPNQVVVSDMFVAATDPAARVSFTDGISKIHNVDQVAITIQVDQIHGVAGFIQPGDFVNMMVLSGDSYKANKTTGAMFSGNARMLFQKVEVLAVGATTVPQPGQATAAAASTTITTGGGVLTLLVPNVAAQQIASVDSSKWYLTLVARDYKPVAVPPVNPSSVPGEDSTQLTPYGPAGAASSN